MTKQKYNWYKEPYLENLYLGNTLKGNLTQVRQNDKWGLIDFEGNFVVDLKADAPMLWKGFIPIKNDNGEIGLKNEDGKIIFPCHSRDIKYIYPHFYFLGDYGQGNLINGKGEILKTEYPLKDIKMPRTQSFEDGIIAVEVRVEEQKWLCGYIDIEGNSITKFIYRQIQPFSEGLALVYDENWSNQCYIDKKDEIIFKLPNEWITARSFKNGLAQFRTEKGSGIIDKNFNIILDDKHFKDITVVNKLIHTNQDGKQGILDLDQNIIVPFEYYSILHHINQHLFLVQKDFFYDKKKHLKCSIYNAKTKSLEFDFIYDNIEIANDKLLIVRKGKMFGYIDHTGNEITKIEFQSVNKVRDNKAWVKQNDKWGVIKFYDNE
jgi:hypothetical protein